MSSQGGLPDVLFKKVDEYVDSLAPQIQPRVAEELELFQQKTIDSLETQVVDAFRSLFNKDKPTSSDGSRGPWNLNDAAPDAYGGQSLPFADEIAKLTRSFSTISGEAGDDLRDIFNLTEGGGGSDQARGGDFESSRGGGGGGGGARSFLSSAINAVQDHLENNNNRGSGGGGQSLEIGGLLGVLSNTLKDTSRNPEEKARLISPEIKDRVGEKLRMQHAPIAEQFTKIALDHIKRWLRGNTSSRDLGDGAKAELEDQVKDLVKGIGGLFGSKKSSNEGSARGFGDSDRDGQGRDGGGGGFSRVLSDKLSTGLAKVHREVRLEFRKILGAIEKQLFEMLPDSFQRPLEKILGGNPFDSQLDRDAGGQTERGFGDDIKAKLLQKIRGLIAKVQETLRESILGVVNGGHRRFERQSWVFVQNMVEQKVQRYLPDVKINVPDDIGNEGVSVGDPTSGSTGMGGTNQPMPPPQDNYNNQGPPGNQHGGGQNRPQQGYNAPPPNYENNQSYRNDPPQDNYNNNQRPPSNQYGGPPQSNYNPPSQYQNDQSYRSEPPQHERHQSGHAPYEQHQRQGSAEYRNEPYQQQGYQGGQQQHQQYQPPPPQQQSYGQQGYQGQGQGQGQNQYGGGDYSQGGYQGRY